ncbi:MAG: hypothetical protein O6705_07215 [Actinobacteria bacterium]|nr:hypothetical protein [Actinomycetota bacterium]
MCVNTDGDYQVSTLDFPTDLLGYYARREDVIGTTQLDLCILGRSANCLLHSFKELGIFPASTIGCEWRYEETSPHVNGRRG